MSGKFAVSAVLAALIASTATAAPLLSVIPKGLQGGNWVWEVDIAPDLLLAPGQTPLAEEIGFRLTGDPLVSVTNLSPGLFDTNIPGNPIFGWETPYGSPPYPEGIEANCAACTVINGALGPGHASTVVPGTTNEIFTAMGSGEVSANVPFLKIVAAGPGSGGPSTSTIQWLGAYIGQGRIAQLVGQIPQGFDIYSGSASQSVPEPSAILLISAALGVLGSHREFTRRRVA
jgi:hypothetical protein